MCDDNNSLIDEAENTNRRKGERGKKEIKKGGKEGREGGRDLWRIC